MVQSSKSAGQTFGELALRIDPQDTNKVIKRAATVSTKTDCIFAVLEKKHYRQILEKIDLKNNENTAEFFRQIPFIK